MRRTWRAVEQTEQHFTVNAATGSRVINEQASCAHLPKQTRGLLRAAVIASVFRGPAPRLPILVDHRDMRNCDMELNGMEGGGGGKGGVGGG
jgi:hypothetical protein